MKDKQQKEKVKIKIDIINSLINSLIKYNSIENYENFKTFNVDINYIYNDKAKCYKYLFRIYRGYKREKIFNFHLSCKDKINSLFDELIENLSLNPNISHTSFNNSYSFDRLYSMHFDDFVTVTFHIHDKDDKKYFDGINSKIQKDVVSINSKKLLSSMREKDKKDILQINKARNVIKIMNMLLESMINYNNIANYENTKNCRFIIEDIYDEKKECYKYKFKVLRGNNFDSLFEMRFSIQNNCIVYEELYDMIMRLLENPSFIYEFKTSSVNKEVFGIMFKNGIEFNFLSNVSRDIWFFEQFKAEPKTVGENRKLEKKPNNVE